VDPTIQLLPVNGNSEWNQDWFKAIDAQVAGGTDHLMVATSYHGGYDNVYNGTPTLPADFTLDAKFPTASFIASVAEQRTRIDSDQAKAGSAQKTPVGLSLDEWGLGPPWRVHEFNVAHGMYGASFFGGVIRNAKKLGVVFTNYFEPINEGAITVNEFDSELTPLGEVMVLFGHHQFNTRLVLPTDSNTNDDLDFTASVRAAAPASASETGSQGTLLLHIVNRNADQAYSLQLQLKGLAKGVVAATKIAEYVLLSPTHTPLMPSTMFAKSNGTMSVSSENKLQLQIPAYGLMEVTVAL
jgi:alpha-L-arabinofuranosidase